MESSKTKANVDSGAKITKGEKDNFGKADLRDHAYGDSYRKTIDSDPNSSKLRPDQDTKKNEQTDKNK